MFNFFTKKISKQEKFRFGFGRFMPYSIYSQKLYASKPIKTFCDKLPVGEKYYEHYGSESSSDSENDSDDESAEDDRKKIYGDLREGYVEAGEMSSHQERRFVDKVRLKFFSGKGGSGSLFYELQRGKSRGKRLGGDGGDGGSIVLRSNWDNFDLSYIKTKHVRAPDGKQGRKSGSNGKNMKPRHYDIPLGTVVYELKTEDIINENGVAERVTNKKYLTYLTEKGQEYTIVKGGQGGRGNKNHRQIKEIEEGDLGVEKHIELELRIMADIGLIGLPNAGKSTLLASMTRALPKIASYPFTTIKPVLGKQKFVDGFNVTIADVPGIIKNSFEKKGLGIEFLRHCGRVKMFAFVLDMSEFATHPALEQLEILREEMGKYDEKLLAKPYMVIANKADTINSDKKTDELTEKLENIFILPASGQKSINIDKLVVHLREKVLETPENREANVESEFL